MIPDAGERPGEVRFRSAVFSREHFGALKFRNMVTFLASAAVEIDKAGFWKERPDMRTTSPAPPSSNVVS
jgi:hypothetical protein